MGPVRVYGNTLCRSLKRQSRRFDSISHCCLPSKAQKVPTAHSSIDVLCLGNLCVDVVQEVEALPAQDVQSRKQLLVQLTQKPPTNESWKVGGSTNFMIAAARLGLTVWSCGHVADDDFGRFLLQVLRDEGISEHLALTEDLDDEILLTTLVCFVLVEASTRSHTFCSRYDFGPWPLLSKFSPSQIRSKVSDAFMNTRAVMMNGFVFDELSPVVVSSLASGSQESGAIVFFDPGPRSFTFTEGPRRQALQAVLRVATVMMVTEGELEAISGEPDSRLGSCQLLQEYNLNMKWIIVKFGSRGSMLAHVCPSTQDVVYTEQGSFHVDVTDTVGCGDSFAAAVVLGYLNQWPHDIVLLLANAMGAATATHEGAGQNVGTLREVLNLLDSAVRNPASLQPTQHDQWQAACREALMRLKNCYEESQSSQDFLEV